MRTLIACSFLAFPALAQTVVIAPVVFSGTGLDDARAGGRYSSAANAHYVVTISAAGTPDQFKWWKNGSVLSPAIAITGAGQAIADGVTIRFSATTGHTVNDSWAITVQANQSTGNLVAAGTSALVSRDAKDGRSENFSVSDSGAKGLGGVTDDTAAIQNAINSMVDGGTLFFPKPAEYYQITKGLQIVGRSNIRLQGAPGAEIRVRAGTTDIVYDAWPTFGQDSIFRIIDSNNVTIDGLTLNGNISNRVAHAGGESSNSAVLVAGSTNVTISHSILKEATTDGVLVMYDASGLPNTNVRIENNEILNNRRNNVSGVAQNHLYIMGNAITGAGTIQGTPPESAIDIEPDYLTTQLSRDVHIEENTIAGSAGDYAVSVVGTAGLTVKSNQIHDNAGYGLNFEAAFIGGFQNTDSILTENEIFNNTKIGVRVVGRNLDVVSSNKIRNNSWGMQVFSSDGLLITSNLFESNLNGGIADGMAAPLGFLNLSIQRNVFRDNNSAMGVANGAGWVLLATPASATSTLAFDENLIFGSPGTKYLPEGLSIAGACQCRGSGNTAYNTQTPPRTFEGLNGARNHVFGLNAPVAP